MYVSMKQCSLLLMTSQERAPLLGGVSYAVDSVQRWVVSRTPRWIVCFSLLRTAPRLFSIKADGIPCLNGIRALRYTRMDDGIADRDAPSIVA